MKLRFHYFWLLLAVILLAFAGSRHRPLHDLKLRHRLVRTDPLENAPPVVAFTTVVLGGFRGILADILWLRLSLLQEQGKFFELVQLADWITKLEPRFPEVWAFHAWNLAYNVSVLFDDPQDRWRWVRSGIELLRDEGLAYNPGEAQLYRELGWLFQHKIGADYDQAHVYYKQAWAREMTEALGGARPNYSSLLTAAPGTSAHEQRVRLTRDYKLNPSIMQDIEKAYGPLDWRMPYAHAVYWAWSGRPYAEGFERVALTRMILQSLSAAFLRGRMVTDAEGRFFLQAADIGLLPATLRAFKNAMLEFPDVQSFRDAYPYLLTEAIMTLCLCNFMDEARSLFDELRRDYNLEETRNGFEAFVFERFVERADSSDTADVLEVMESVAFRAAQWRLFGEQELAKGHEAVAELLWRAYAQQPAQPDRPKKNLPPLQALLEKGAREAEAAFRARP